MATNTKGRIIIGASAVIVVSLTAYLIFSGVRKRRILRDIYDQLTDVKSAKGKMAQFRTEEKIKGTWAFNPQFWQGKLEAKPNATLLNQFSTTKARDVARAINSAIGYVSEDESQILAQVKKLKSQGQVSLVAYVYENTPLNYGSLADNVINALTGYADGEDMIKQLNNYVINLPL